VKSAIGFFARINIVVALIYSSVSVFAGSPSDASSIGRLRIDLISIPDWIETKPIEKEPEKLLMRLARREGEVIPIAEFNQDGPAYPELVSAFKNKVGGKQVLFAIVKWRYYLSGIDTEGDYYEVHAFEAQKNEGGEIVFSENKEMSDFFGSGFDGKQEGKMVHFRFKDASSIRKSLRQSKSWK
jgi:hypothetical protein